ncbi:unnamed protein product [Prorocentrum cordatum]|uniref:RNase H type-1 domain-containing protein n=1 Tax=Prorocentrum cordatum TaxID=2364126 RepID=A0ABN9X5D8_9DINO|nr:unnamed protein product [Polarella glacialis]
MIYPASWPPWSQDHPTPEEGEGMRGVTQHEADTDLASTSRASSVPAEQGDPPTPTASQVIFIPASPAPPSERSLTPTVPIGNDEQRGQEGGEGVDSFEMTPPPASQQGAEAAAASIERQYEGIDILTRQHTSAAAAVAALEKEVRVPRGQDSNQGRYRSWCWQWEDDSQTQQPATSAFPVTRVSRGQCDTATADARAARRVSRGARSNGSKREQLQHFVQPSGQHAVHDVLPRHSVETNASATTEQRCTQHSTYGHSIDCPCGFRGFIAGKVTESLHDMANNEKVTAYTAELTAVLWAVMWALGQDTTVPIEITPDALDVMHLAKGDAQCHVHPRLGAAIRSLAGLLQEARPTQWNHINSHFGHPWNELADGVADHASATDLMDPDLAAVQAIAHNKFLSWEWFRTAPGAVKAAYPPMQNQAFIIGATQPQAAPSAIQRPISTTTIKADLSLKLCTYNCRSLLAAVNFKSGKGKAASKSKQSISKVTHLAAQFSGMGLHLVALKETQSDGDVRHVGEYVCYSPGHTQQNRGCDIWINVSKPISVGGVARYLSAKDALVLHQHDRRLIIKTRVAGTDMVIASACAPHEESQSAEKTEFWESAQRLAAKYHVDIFMGDLNGRLGDCESPGVGASGYPEPTNGNGKHIINFAADTDMEVINTTKDPGSDSYTHTGSKGQRHRIDYILLCSSIAPYVASCSTTTKASGPRPDLSNLNNDDAKASFKEILKQAPIIPWEVDVNTHCEEVTRVVNDAAIQAFGKAVKAARKPYITKTTMGEVGASLSLWSAVRGDDDGAIYDIHYYANLLLNWAISPMDYAMAIHSFLTRSGLLTASAVEKDRSVFLSRLASTATSASAANDAAAQWKAYRDLLRYGGKKARFPAGKPMRLDQNGEVVHNSQDMADQELNHFAKIQAGKIVTADDLAHKYNQDSQTRPFDGMLDLSMVMPLSVCQAQFAAAKAGAQGGPDGLTNAILRAAPAEAAKLLHPLFTKVATTVREPLSFKGGDLVASPKGKGDPRYLLAYREIPLNNVLGKHRHTYLRTMLNATLAIALDDIQVGGRPKRGSDMAVLAARLFTERSQAQGKYSMISCYDLKEAFYSVVVQLVHSIPGEEDEVREVLDNLEVPLWAQPQLEQLMANPGILDTVLDGSHLAALIAEGYRNRWTSRRFSQSFMAPHKGTRPGVPLADADFNLLFGRVHRMVDSYLHVKYLSDRVEYCEFERCTVKQTTSTSTTCERHVTKQYCELNRRFKIQYWATQAGLDTARALEVGERAGQVTQLAEAAFLGGSASGQRASRRAPACRPRARLGLGAVAPLLRLRERIHQVLELNLADLNNDEDQAYKKVKLCIEEVQGRNCLTDFHALELTRDKQQSLIRKWHTLIEAHVDVKTTDGYLVRLFCLAFTKKQPGQEKNNCYAQTAQIRKIRKKMTDIMTGEVNKVQLRDLVKKLIPESIGKQIEKDAGRASHLS